MLHNQNFRKVLLVFMDLIIVITVFLVMLLLNVSEHMVQGVTIETAIKNIALYLACNIVLLVAFKMYDSLWRYAEVREYLNLILCIGLACILYMWLARVLLIKRAPCAFILSVSALSLLAMLAIRFLYRQLRQYKRNEHPQERRVRLAIVGAGSAGVGLLEEIQRKTDSSYLPVCFFDDDPVKAKKEIHGIPILGNSENLIRVCKEQSIHEIIIAIPSVGGVSKRKIVEACSKTGCRVKILPDPVALMENQYDRLMRTVRSINVDDLLGRESICFDNQNVKTILRGKTVLVTGGGGSIGSELCMQIMQCAPKKLVVVDIYENNVYDLQQKLKLVYGADMPLTVEIASVRDSEKIFRLFEKYRPQVVFHAAAHKHVPLMEDCPEEAVKNNVFGTYHVAQAADRYHAEKFVLISTDKAVNPTNIMGATKRLCEMIVQSIGNGSATKFVAVRFGNVLGSNGSVIPLFQRQIENGGPVTITDKKIIRYFMTIPEAAQLVLQAAAMAERSEVYVLDMGEPVKILDLAENLIRLSGYHPYEDIDIVETGLRPGEKLYEELLMASEELVSTENHKIFIERQRAISLADLQTKLHLLNDALNTCSEAYLRNVMHQTVPTYREPAQANRKIFIQHYDELEKTGNERPVLHTS